MDKMLTLMTSSSTFAQSLAVTLVVEPRAGDELISSNHGYTGAEGRVITHIGAKPCRLRYSWNLLLTFLGSRHCTCLCISWFKEEGWKYFCRFVFVYFNL